MRTLKLMPDYECWPLWESGDNIDPEGLPLSAELRARLAAWADAFDARLDWDDPGNSPPMEQSTEMAFLQEASRLVEDLQRELGPDWRILPWPEQTSESEPFPRDAR